MNATDATMIKGTKLPFLVATTTLTTDASNWDPAAKANAAVTASPTTL
jgi:hypothetical protein